MQISQLSLVFETWVLGQSWILAKPLPLTGFKTAQEHMLLVGRYCLNDYKTNRI